METRKERAFEKLIEKAMEDDYWMQLNTMRTRLPLQKRKEEILEAFKNHVILMGTETKMYSVNDAKYYFANFTRIGTPTYNDLIKELAAARCRGRISMQDEEDLYRFEQVDITTGERSYCGIKIPADAPPRPNENAVWINGEWKL